MNNTRKSCYTACLCAKTSPYGVAGYLSADARIGLMLTEDVSLAASIVNLQRQDTRTSVGQSVEREAYGTLTVKF